MVVGGVSVSLMLCFYNADCLKTFIPCERKMHWICIGRCRIKPGKVRLQVYFFFNVSLVCCSKTNGQDWMTVLILILSDGHTPFLKRQTDRKMWLLFFFFFFLQGLRGGVCSIHRWFKGTAINVSLGRVFTTGETQEWRSNGCTKFPLTFWLHPA